MARTNNSKKRAREGDSDAGADNGRAAFASQHGTNPVPTMLNYQLQALLPEIHVRLASSENATRQLIHQVSVLPQLVQQVSRLSASVEGLTRQMSMSAASGNPQPAAVPAANNTAINQATNQLGQQVGVFPQLEQQVSRLSASMEGLARQMSMSAASGNPQPAAMPPANNTTNNQATSQLGQQASHLPANMEGLMRQMLAVGASSLHNPQLSAMPPANTTTNNQATRQLVQQASHLPANMEGLTRQMLAVGASSQLSASAAANTNSTNNQDDEWGINHTVQKKHESVRSLYDEWFGLGDFDGVPIRGGIANCEMKFGIQWRDKKSSNRISQQKRICRVLQREVDGGKALDDVCREWDKVYIQQCGKNITKFVAELQERGHIRKIAKRGTRKSN
ncbi:unnamed protein product [Cylindrotheca closterium]|uniref:Transcription activator GCR1-like domain-containing protein n=1 Tax=Cylindrotheca closterium TaxID=2856 RepID=A0AAD2G6F3_9STRA|nr:unnamed protein product [Cylindrotheca closterium]